MATLVLSDVEALKGWLRVTGSSLDVLVEDLENSTVRILEALVGRTYALDAGHVEILDGEGASSVVLSDAPPSGTLTEVVVRQGHGTDWGDPEDLLDFEIEAREVFWVETFPLETRSVRVTYDRGYSPGSAPELVEQAVKDVAAFLWRGRGTTATTFKGLNVRKIGAGVQAKLCQVPSVMALRAERGAVFA